jgi:cell shape-determining protein MreD
MFVRDPVFDTALPFHSPWYLLSTHYWGPIFPPNSLVFLAILLGLRKDFLDFIDFKGQQLVVFCMVEEIEVS